MRICTFSRALVLGPDKDAISSSIFGQGVSITRTNAICQGAEGTFEKQHECCMGYPENNSKSGGFDTVFKVVRSWKIS